jgi:hypothetical protein
MALASLVIAAMRSREVVACGDYLDVARFDAALQWLGY